MAKDQFKELNWDQLHTEPSPVGCEVLKLVGVTLRRFLQKEGGH